MPSYEQNDKGKWSVRWRDFDGAREHNRRLSGYKTKREAKEAYEEYISTHIVQKKAKLTPVECFDDLAVAFLEYKKGQIKESSYLAYQTRVAKHILPFFKGKRTRDIKPLDILKWQATLKDFAYGYKKTLRGNLHTIFDFGRKYYGLQNPVEDVEGFKDNDENVKEMRIWSPQEFSTFIDKVDDPKYHALFRFLYASGCRIGEALALTRADIQDRTVHINKTLSVRTEGANWKITTPKNKYSIRTIDIPQSIADELLDLTGKKFVFSATDNNPLHPNSVQHALKKYERAANVTPIRIHDFRHSHASFLLSSGIPITAVSKRLGHKNAQITLQIYAHSLPADNDAISSALEGI